jgi:hypothetical protein
MKDGMSRPVMLSASTTSGQPKRSDTRSIGTNVLFGMLVFLALGAVGGGLALTIEPGGSTIGLDPGLLEGSPFRDYLVPGLVLLIGLALEWRVGVHILVIDYNARPLLQLAYAVLGLAILTTTISGPVRRDLTNDPAIP